MVHLIDMPLDHPSSEKLIEQLGGSTPQLVKRASGGPYGRCYWNVAEIIERQNGQLVLGWRLHLFPGAFLVANHHAVWQRPDGQLRDVTPSPPEIFGTSTFVEDSSIPAPLDWPTFIEDRWWPLVEHPAVAACRAAYIQQNNLARALMKQLRAEGGVMAKGGWGLPKSIKPSTTFEALRSAHQRAEATQKSAVDAVAAAVSGQSPAA